MNAFLKTLFGMTLQTPETEVVHDSPSALFQHMALFDSMYIQANGTKKEIKRTLTGYHERELTGGHTVVFYPEAQHTQRVVVISNAKWHKVDTQAGLQHLFKDLDNRTTCPTSDADAWVVVHNQNLIVKDVSCSWSPMVQYPISQNSIVASVDPNIE